MSEHEAGEGTVETITDFQREVRKLYSDYGLEFQNHEGRESCLIYQCDVPMVRIHEGQNLDSFLDVLPPKERKETSILMNETLMSQGIELFLKGAGIEIDNQHMRETPARVARAWRDAFLSGYQQDVSKILSKQFDDPTEQMIVVKDISFVSTCAHHLVPFFGTAKIGYIPSGRVVGLSKLARVLDAYARRLQIQEQLTRQVAEAIMEHLNPSGVGVIIEAEHMCMTTRGVSKPGAKTVTSVLLGNFLENLTTRSEFLSF